MVVETLISGQDNEKFGIIWAESDKNGLIDKTLATGLPLPPFPNSVNAWVYP
jgi:hypothetical protein